jgi:hypothetical protein
MAFSSAKLLPHSFLVAGQTKAVGHTRVVPGIVPGISRTFNENHTTRQSNQLHTATQ